MTTPNIPATLQDLTVPIGDLRHYGKNPRKGDVEAIAESLKYNGQFKPIVVRKGTNEVLAGNHTLKAARDVLKWDRIAATYMDCTDDEAARIVVADNRTSDLATNDYDILKEVLGALPNLEGTGYTTEDLEGMLHGIQEPATPKAQADDYPEQVPTISRPGDVWHLGRHRVVCGDATDPAAYRALLNGKPADLMWTDPPYGVDYVGKTKEALTIQGDGNAGLFNLLTAAFPAAGAHLKQGAPIYIAHSDTERITFETAARQAGYSVRQNLIWVKNAMVLGHSDYHYRHEPILEAVNGQEEPTAPAPARAAQNPPEEDLTHEPILYGFNKGGNGRLGRGGKRWYGTNNRTTVFEIPKPPASREHPTMKPVALILAMLANSARPGHTVLDPFGGSGSTLIAAETHGAKAALIELDPHYVDVICARYQRVTGRTVKRPDGTVVDFTKGK